MRTELYLLHICGSLLPVCQIFSDVSHIMLVRFVLLSGHLEGNSCSLG